MIFTFYSSWPVHEEIWLTLFWRQYVDGCFIFISSMMCWVRLTVCTEEWGSTWLSLIEVVDKLGFCFFKDVNFVVVENLSFSCDFVFYTLFPSTLNQTRGPQATSLTWAIISIMKISFKELNTGTKYLYSAVK